MTPEDLIKLNITALLPCSFPEFFGTVKRDCFEIFRYNKSMKKVLREIYIYSRIILTTPKILINVIWGLFLLALGIYMTVNNITFEIFPVFD